MLLVALLILCILVHHHEHFLDLTIRAGRSRQAAATAKVVGSIEWPALVKKIVVILVVAVAGGGGLDRRQCPSVASAHLATARAIGARHGIGACVSVAASAGAWRRLVVAGVTIVGLVREHWLSVS